MHKLREVGVAYISRSTITRRLHDVGLFDRTGAKKTLISEKSQTTRLTFVKKHLHWTTKKWKNVAFLDESKFYLFGNDEKQYVRRPMGRRYDARYQIPTVKHSGGNVQIWNVFSAQGVDPLIEIKRNMDGVMYCDILDNNLLQNAESNMSENWVILHDNDPKHSSKVVQQWLSSKDINFNLVISFNLACSILGF